MTVRGRSHYRQAAGMTLLEVLAAIFVLGMGLVMVAGAFPVGEDQTARAVYQTEAAALGRSAVELCRAQKYVRHLSGVSSNDEYHNGYKSLTLTVPRGDANEPWRVWNPYRWAYLEHGLDATGALDDTLLWKSGGSPAIEPRSGDYIWKPFITRLSDQGAGAACKEAPLFRVTIVVARHAAMLSPLFDSTKFPSPSNPKYLGWDLYDPTYPAYTSGGPIGGTGTHYMSVSPVAGTDPIITCSDMSNVEVGGWIMDGRTGLCYQVAFIDPANNHVTLANAPVPPLLANTYCYSFGSSNIMGIFYTLVSE